MACDGREAKPGDPPREQHFWERTAAIWHVVFSLGLAAVAVAAVAEHGFTDPQSIATLALLVLLSVWYVAVGAPALHRGNARLGHIYLVGVLPIFGLLLALDEGMGFLLFFTIPQVYIYIDSLIVASLCVTGLYATFAGVLLIRHEEVRDQPGMFALQMGVSLAFSLLFGGWIGGIIRQSTKRAELIAELEHTRAELAAERHEAGVLTERTRLAAEIHDTLAQGFTSILMLTQAAETMIADDPDAAREQLALIDRTARENLAEARSLVAALAPAALDGATLPEALHRLGARHSQETGTSVEVTVSGAPTSAPETDVVLLRAAQEALANVRKHATARHVEVALGYTGDGASLVVSDDGKGFEPAMLNGSGARGYGLRAMRLRVEQSGGTVNVTSQPGGGTTVRVALQ